MKRFRHLLAMTLSFSLALPLILSVALPVASAELKTTDRYVHDFNNVPIASDFSADSTGFGMSFVGGYTRAMAVSGSDAISGRSIRVNAADMRWWSVNYTDTVMGFSIDVRIDGGFKDTELYWCGQNHVQSTTTESENGGRLIVVRSDENGDPALYNYEGDKVASLERNKNYTIAAEAVYGEPTYTLYVNGEAVSSDNRFADAFFSVIGLKLYAKSDSSDSYIIVDNLRAYTKGREYPQKNSFQEPGRLPTVTLPDVPSVEGVAVYVNDTLVPVAALTDESGLLLPLAETAKAFGGKASMQTDGNVRIESQESKASFTLASDTLYWNDESVKLSRTWQEKDGVLFVSPQVFAEVMGAKVWYDANLSMVVLTTGERLADNVLRSIGGTFWMNGEPYYEISFNKWDLNHQIASDPQFNNGEFVSRSWCTTETTIAGAERALKELSENGFKTIRVFCDNINPCKGEEAVEEFFEQSDFMYDLCDKYGIRVVACLGLMDKEFLDMKYVEGTGWVNGTEDFCDFITDPDSASRKHVYDFIDLYVNRYKDRDTVLMWEICNEGNLDADVGYESFATYSLIQLGEFYTDVAARIKANDPERLVTGGDSMLRSGQWHLLKATMEGRVRDFTTDTAEQRLMALWMINSGLDVISIHGYGVGYANEDGHAYYYEKRGDRLNKKVVDWDFMLGEANTLGLPLYVGELNGMMDENNRGMTAENTAEAAGKARARYLENLIDDGVQLAHWWAFNSDRVDFDMDLDTWSCTIKDTPETFNAVKEANETLKARYLVNPLSDENTHTLSDKTGEGATVVETETAYETVEESTYTEEPVSMEESTRAEETASADESTDNEGSSKPTSAEKGCKSSLTAIGICTAVAVGTTVISKKKKENT